MVVLQETLEQELSLELLKKILENGGKIFIYGNGGAGRWLWRGLEGLGMKVQSFIDSDVKKLTVNFGFHTINLVEGEEKITSKDLRTWNANNMLLEYIKLSEIKNSKNPIKKAIEKVSEKLHNSYHICLKSYINPLIVQKLKEKLAK